MKNKLLLLFILSCIGYVNSIQAQDLLDQLNKEFPQANSYEIATFKATRIGLGQSIETRKKNVFEIVIMNRFWDHPKEYSQTTEQSFVSDELNTRIGLEYAFTDKFTLGIGASTWDKVFDGFIKQRLWQQSNTKSGSPVGVTFFQNITLQNKLTTSYSGQDKNNEVFSSTTQLLIARKITTNTSIQLSPSFIHRGSTLDKADPTNQFAIGIGGRRKIGQHTSIVSEYFYVANPIQSSQTFNAFSIGVNWELSYIMLQFQLTNTSTFAEDRFITQTANNFNFKQGNLNFGFNATFTLQTDKKKRKKKILE